MPVHVCGSRYAREGTSSEADPARGKRRPSSEADPARRRCEPSSEVDLIRGGFEPSSEADLARGGRFAGPLRWAAGATTAWIVLCVCFALGPRLVLRFVFFAGFKHDSPRFFRGPSWLSPTVAPEHLRVYRSGSRRCWSLLIVRSSLPVANAFPRGRVSGPAGLAPEALQERECSCRGFSRGILSVGVVHVSTGIGGVSADFGDARAAGIFRVRCISGGVAVRQAPEPGPV
jgi:hypothetical protein